MASTKKVTLRSSDGETFEVEEAVALESQTIKHMVEDDCADTVIPLPNVSSKILAKVIEYCKKHVDSPTTEDNRQVDEELKSWDVEFVKVDQATLFDLILVTLRSNVSLLEPADGMVTASQICLYHPRLGCSSATSPHPTKVGTRELLLFVVYAVLLFHACAFASKLLISFFHCLWSVE